MYASGSGAVAALSSSEQRHNEFDPHIELIFVYDFFIKLVTSLATYFFKIIYFNLLAGECSNSSLT